jgi:hypothetical protein
LSSMLNPYPDTEQAREVGKPGAPGPLERSVNWR